MGESIVYAIKIALAVAASLAFVTAIITLVSLLASLATSSILGEVIGLISVYLPFKAGTVFASLSSSIIAVIAFLIAHKVWSMTLVTENV